ncbi:MAG: polyamine aminopropyltransferase [bacterium]
MSQWVSDMVGPGFAQATEIDEILFDRRSAYQRVQIARSELFGRMLILDDAVQTTERDEFIYHEMLVHLPLVTHPGPRRVLIIGGGDGGALKEALKHPLVAATMVDIDGEVIAASRRYLPAISAGAFDHPRAHVRVEDGIAFVHTTAEQFDCIAVDSTDPKGPGLALFSDEFFAGCARVLTDEGVLAVQSGSLLYQRSLGAQVVRALEALFPVVAPYWAPVPSYPGVLWGFTCASRRFDPRTLTADAIAMRLAGIETRFYSPAAHRAALVIPALPAFDHDR